MSRFSALQRAENSSDHERIVRIGMLMPGFSALQRAENSSELRRWTIWRRSVVVSVLFSEPKIPQKEGGQQWRGLRSGFSALQRAENSSDTEGIDGWSAEPTCFSALQRAENSSDPTLAPASIHISDCDDHASSFLSLPGASP